MKKSVILVFLALVSISANAVNNGAKAVNSQFPALTKITIKAKILFFKIPASVCTGTFISPNHILTAAHCTKEAFLSDFEGDKKEKVSKKIALYASTPGQVDIKSKLKVVKEYVNKNYIVISSKNKPITERLKIIEAKYSDPKLISKRDLDEIKDLTDKYESNLIQASKYDMAILEIEEEQLLTSYPRIATYGQELQQNDKVTLVGFGKNVVFSGNVNPDLELNFGFSRLIKAKNLDPSASDYFYTHKAGPRFSNDGGGGKVFEENSRINQGDSGGPLFKEGNQNIIYGIASFGRFSELSSMVDIHGEESHHVKVNTDISNEWINSLTIEVR